MSTVNIIRDEHFKLLAFLITSARGCVDEPPLYGPLRLIDAAERLISLMEKRGIINKDLLEIKAMIGEKKGLVMYDEKEFIKFLDELVLRIAKIIKESKEES